MQALAFQNTQFDIVDRNNQPWLRLPQIEGALGYANAGKALSNIYSRNSDEFTDRMTALVELETAGGKQQVRIFSLRGAHLLGMLSRTKAAKEFRAWVLDVLEGIAEAPAKPKRQPKALPNGLTIDQQDAIKALVKARVESLPKEKQAKAAITCWSALKSKFGCTYKEINPELYADAVSLVARVTLEGEYIERDASQFDDLDYRAQAAKFSLDYVHNLHKHIDNPSHPKPVYDNTEADRLADGLTASMLHHSRWLMSFSWDGRPVLTPVPSDASVLTRRQMLEHIASADAAVPTDELFQFVVAATDQLKKRSAYTAKQIARAKQAGLRLN